MKTIGFIVNPIAGIGGKVGLKGSDGLETLQKALALGAEPESGKKTLGALKEIAEGQDVNFLTCPGAMGADVLREAGLDFDVVPGLEDKERTTPEDTIAAARKMRDANVDLIVFSGGDGTARNILDAVGTDVPVVGIPTGVKIHSAVYSINPKTGGRLIEKYIRNEVTETELSEVMDIDEDLFRQNIVSAKLYGYLRTLKAPTLVQSLKSGRQPSEEANLAMLANYVKNILEDGVLYIVGPGSTTFKVLENMDLEGTLLGVDLLYNGRLIATDVTEKEILATLPEYPKRKILVTVIGGQGYLFGRGNQQISADVIREVGRDNIMVAASKNKMHSLFGRKLYVDTGDDEVNAMLRGYYKVIVGYEDYHMFEATD